jgi:hypothetical protein
MMTLVPILCVVGSLYCAAKAVASLPRPRRGGEPSAVARAHGERRCHAFVVGERSVRSLAE